jgi:hypothetical protein
MDSAGVRRDESGLHWLAEASPLHLLTSFTQIDSRSKGGRAASTGSTSSVQARLVPVPTFLPVLPFLPFARIDFTHELKCP